MAKLTKAQRRVLAHMAQTGEALRQGWEFRGCDGLHVCQTPLMARLEGSGFVNVEQVGGSTFATITDAGRQALSYPCPG
jgi:hypothetical protein